MTLDSDIWSDWLLHRRQAGDPEHEAATRVAVDRFADRVLDFARLTEGMTLVDVGSGEGTLAFRAIDRVGPSLRVTLTDISAPLLSHAQSTAAKLGLKGQCIFVECPADNLAPIPDRSVDVVATRSVLAYVEDKKSALREFFRVLNAGGRISLAEPIVVDDAYATMALRNMASNRTGEVTELYNRWKAAQYPDTEEKRRQNPLTNYTERDLVTFTQAAGFVNVHMEFHIDVVPAPTHDWNVFLDVAPHPMAPTLRTIMAEQFTADERRLFEQVVRPTVEDPNAVTIERIAYLTATKPQE